MNDFLRKRMAEALAYLKAKGHEVAKFEARLCEFERTLPWSEADSGCVPWESYNPIFFSPDRSGVAFRQGKGWVILQRSGSHG